MSTVTIPAGLPAPVRGRTPDNDRGIGSDRRTYEFSWLVGAPVPDGFDQGIVNNGLRLMISHYRSTKDYRATVKVVRLHALGSTETFAFGGPRLDADIGNEPGARYSRKTLDAFAARVLAEFPDSIPADSEPGQMWARIVAADKSARGAV